MTNNRAIKHERENKQKYEYFIGGGFSFYQAHGGKIFHDIISQREFSKSHSKWTGSGPKMNEIIK